MQGSVDQLPICFHRIPAKELLEQGFDNVRPRWLLLNEDKVSYPMVCSRGQVGCRGQQVAKKPQRPKSLARLAAGTYGGPPRLALAERCSSREGFHPPLTGGSRSSISNAPAFLSAMVMAHREISRAVRTGAPRAQVLDCLPKGQYPGSLLIKLALGNLRPFKNSFADWNTEALRLRHRTSYLLRVHVYQVGGGTGVGLGFGWVWSECRGRWRRALGLERYSA